jgi:membrane-bound lytic murein transglycosylase D
MQELAFYHRLYSDWILAVASYNAGPTRIGNIRRENGLEGYWELMDADVLPPETRNYVPQIIAVAYISTHRGRFGLPVEWEAPVRWSRIPLNRSVHLGQLSQDTGIDFGILQQANRELHHPVTPPPSLPYFLKIPEKNSPEVYRWLENRSSEDTPERFWRYTVGSGDTLSEIAGRSGISLSELLSYNSHVRGGVLRIGEKLYLPGDETMPEGADSDEIPVWNGRYHVRNGDTFWSIAVRYGIRPELLAEANHRSLTGVLLAGSVLKVPEEGGEM